MQVPYRKPGKYSQTANDPLMTEGKKAELEQELEKLKKVSKPKAMAEVSRLAEFGDFSENAEYQLAKGKLRGINNAIHTIEVQLNQAVIIPTPLTKSTVRIGSTVTVQNEGKEKVYQILGSSETNPAKGVISHTSPIGAALLGHRVGDEVAITINQKEVVLTIHNIA